MIYLTSPAYIKSLGLVDSNVDDQLILKSINDAQEIELQQVIGTKLLNTLKTQIDTNTLTADNTYLLDNYILPTLSMYSVYFLALHLNFRVTARGVVTKEADSSSPVDVDSLNDYREEIRNVAEFYAQRLIRYVLANISKYQDFFTIQSIDQMRGKLNSYSIGWVLGNKRKRYFIDVDKSMFRGDCL